MKCWYRIPDKPSRCWLSLGCDHAGRLEAVQLIPAQKFVTFAALAGTDLPYVPHLGHWRLRAQANSQRHYEIYLVSAEPGITAEDIREMFDNGPQTAADTCRRLGQMFYSDRATTKPVIV